MLPINWMESPKEQKTRETIDVLARALTPEPLAEVPVDPGPSKGKALLAGILGSLGSGLTAFGGGGARFDAVDLLNKRRQAKRDAEAENVQIRQRNKAGPRKALAQAEAQVALRDLDAEDRATSAREIDMRQALNDARDLGVEVSETMPLDQINALVAKGKRDLRDAGKASIMEDRANDLLNSAASSRVQIPPALAARMKKGDEAAFNEARNIVAARPEAADRRVDDRYEKDQDERLDEAMDAVEDLIRGAPQTDKTQAVPSIRELAAQGKDLQRIWKDFKRNLARLRLDDKRMSQVEKFFWDYAYPEFMDEYGKRFNAQK